MIYIPRILLLIIGILVSYIIYKIINIKENLENLNNKNNKIIFITFGSDNNYIEAGNRLITQANNINLFDKTLLYTEDNLKNDKNFWDKHSNFIMNNKRGYGYWLWKPYIIKKTMESLIDGDILLYLDCGCEIDIKKKNNLMESIEIVKKDYIIATYTFADKEWTKMDLIMKLDMNNDEYLNAYQHQAGAILILVCDKTRDLVNKWYDIGCDYHMIDDTPSINPNLSCFIEHRHDQSIFSLLTKKYNLYSNHNLYNSIEYVRNKSGNTTISD
jgi:hypothetical protein